MIIYHIIIDYEYRSLILYYNKTQITNIIYKSLIIINIRMHLTYNI